MSDATQTKENKMHCGMTLEAFDALTPEERREAISDYTAEKRRAAREAKKERLLAKNRQTRRTHWPQNFSPRKA